MATLKVPSNVPALADDCDNLRKAFQGWGTNEALIISILGHRDAAQRRAIRKHYADTYGEELLRSITDEISGDFERAVILWTLDPAERDAVLANETAKKWHPGNPVLVEIACARGSKQLFAVRQAYHDRFKRSLEEDVAAHITGDFRKLLVPLVSSHRYEGPEVNTRLAHSEAKLLHEKIEHKAYGDDEVIRILTTRSKAQHSIITMIHLVTRSPRISRLTPRMSFSKPCGLLSGASPVLIGTLRRWPGWPLQAMEPMRTPSLGS
ncbi:hypothetical protein VPH35_128067 [Triticum aestivum]